MVDVKAHKAVATIDVGTGPRPGTIFPDGRRLYMNVDDPMGFLVIDTAARKVIGKATYTLTPDEQAVRSRSHGLAVANDGKEVWSNDVVHNLTFIFDVIGKSAQTDCSVRRRPAAVSDHVVERRQDHLCDMSEQRRLIAFDVVAKKEKGRIQFPKGSRPTRMLTVAAASLCAAQQNFADGHEQGGGVSSAPRSRFSRSRDRRGRRPAVARRSAMPLFRAPSGFLSKRWRPGGILCFLSARRSRTSGGAGERVLISGVLFRTDMNLSAVCVTCPHERCQVDLVTDEAPPGPNAWQHVVASIVRMRMPLEYFRCLK